MYTRETTIGSINSFQNMIKLKSIMASCTRMLTGDISIAFNNNYKIYYTYFEYVSTGYNGIAPNDSPSTNISGNISVFADKYDFEILVFSGYSNIVGELKLLKNLKKLYQLYLRNTGCTGSKTDLWNNGANVYYFSI